MKEEGFACDLEPEFALIWASHQALLAATLLLLMSRGQPGTRRGGGAGVESPHFPRFLAWGCFTCCGTNPFFFFFLFNHLSFESQDLIFSCSVPCGGGGEAASKQALLLLDGAQPVLVPPHITRTAPCHEGQAEGKHTAWHGLWFIARVFGANI